MKAWKYQLFFWKYRLESWLKKWQKATGIFYIGGSDVFPPPLKPEEEALLLEQLGGEDDLQVKSVLIERNLRLVVYIARKFENTGINVEDLISIGTIGLIKAINTFKTDKNIKLATYASRCIENEILMYLRRNSKTRAEVSIDEPLNVDWEGNELLLSDILGTESDAIYKSIEDEVNKDLLPSSHGETFRQRAADRADAFWNLAGNHGTHPKGGGRYFRYLPILYFPSGKEDHGAAEKRNE